jgi:hypothetical protein
LGYYQTDVFQVAKALGPGHSISQRALAELFRQIEKFFRRFEIYTKVPPTQDMKEIMVKVMAEVLSVLAIATKELKQGKASELTTSARWLPLAYEYKGLVLNTLVGNTKIKDALGRIEKLTKEEALVMAARAMDVAHRAHDEVAHVASVVEAVDGKVMGIGCRMNGIASRVTYLEGKISPFREIINSEQLFLMDYPYNPNIVCRSHRPNENAYQYR